MRRYQVKGLLHSVRETTKPGNCRRCKRTLPTPRHTATRLCDECKSDPVRLEKMREAENKKERDRAAAKLASRPKILMICQHREKEKKNSPICGVKFEAEPRIGKDGVDRGVHPNQQFCGKHRTRSARLRRNTTGAQRRVWALNYRHRNLDKVRQKQRKAAKDKRARIAAILASGLIPSPAPQLKSSPREGRGRPRDESKRNLIARLLDEGFSLSAMSSRIYAETQNTAYENTRQSFSRNRTYIKNRCKPETVARLPELFKNRE